MNTNISETIADMVDYIFNIRWHEVPYHIAMVAVLIGVAYCAALILIGFPVAIWEHFSKKKVDQEKEKKITKVVTICLSIIFLCRLLYEWVT